VSDYQEIQFEGCTVAVIAPEDLAEKDAEIERLRARLAEANLLIRKVAKAPLPSAVSALIGDYLAKGDKP
jgi:hypothetical protein